MKKRKTWLGTLSQTLTQNPHIFVSGFSDLNESGWWKLKCFQTSPKDLIIQNDTKRNTRGVKNSLLSAMAIKEKRAQTQEAKDIRKMASQPPPKRIRVDYKTKIVTSIVKSTDLISKSPSEFTLIKQPDVTKEKSLNEILGDYDDDVMEPSSGLYESNNFDLMNDRLPNVDELTSGLSINEDEQDL